MHKNTVFAIGLIIISTVATIMTLHFNDPAYLWLISLSWFTL